MKSHEGSDNVCTLAAKKSRVNGAASDIFEAVSRFQSLMLESSRESRWNLDNFKEVLDVLRSKITAFRSLMRSRVTRLWLKKLARKKRARSRKMKEVKLTKEWEVIETAAIAKFVDKRYEKAVDRIKEDCGYIRHVHRNKVNVENNTMSLLKTKLKDLKAKARIFENLVRCRSGFCNIRMEESSQEKKRHGRKRKRKGSSKCRNKIKRLLVIRNGWDRYLSESELGFKP